MSQTPSHSIPLNTVLGERYKVTAASIETADGDAVLEGQDQVLNRKVSIVVSSPHHNDRLITNARTMATHSRSNIQILDLGNTEGRTYLITSHSRSDVLLNNLLADSQALAATSETKEALGQELFGEDDSTQKTSYVAPAAGAASISATRAASSLPSEEEPADGAEQEYEDYDEYDEYPDEQDFDDEDGRRRGGVWMVAIAAIILLVIGVAAVFSNLNGMVDQEASNEAAGLNETSSASASASATETAKATASATPSKKKVEPKLGTVTRLIPSNQSFMADQDSTLGHLTDGNESTSWISSGFGSANFGGAIESFALTFELKEETKVSQLKINQTGGSGGAFTVYTNDSASLDGATEVGSGSFDDATVTVDLDASKQGEGVKFVIVEFTEAPQLSQPIVSGYPYGTRINEVTASN